MARFELFYRVINGGDGSASVAFHMSKSAAEKAEEKDNDEYGEGWAESSVGGVDLEVIDGEIYYVGNRWDAKSGKRVEFKNKLAKKVK